MAEENTVTMTVENIDQLFPEIVVNGESHISENYVPPVQLEQSVPQTVEEEEEPSTPAQVVQGQDVHAVELNDVLHDFVDPSVTQGLADEIQTRRNADTALQNSINTINSKIPSQASAENQLADKNFVNSSIATNTANFIGTFESVTDLRAYTGTVTDNDYAFVVNAVVQYNGGDFPNVTALNNYDKTTLTNGDYAWVVNAEDNTKYDLYRFDIVEQSWVLRNTKIDKSQDVLNNFYNRYKATVSGSTVTWLYEYTLNNSSFTAEQWATINSGLTQQSVDEDIQEAISQIGSGITVYDTEEELEEDLPNLSDGDIVATYGDGEPIFNDAPLGSVMSYLGTTDPSDGKWLICDGRDTTGTAIELETHYPSLYMFLGGTNVLPEIFDHSRPSAIETLNLTTTNQAVPYDGHIIDTCATNAGSNLYVNDVLVGYNMYYNGNRNTCVIPVRKGDLIRRSETTVGIYSAVWYKSHKIIKATSSVDYYHLPSTEIAQVEQYFDEGLQRAESYSTTETWTGGYWIDGKKIYRKVYDGLNFGGTVNNWVNTGATTTGVDRLINATVMRYDSVNDMNAVISLMNIRVQISTGNIQYYTTTTVPHCDKIIIEYTKTTD